MTLAADSQQSFCLPLTNLPKLFYNFATFVSDVVVVRAFNERVATKHHRPQKKEKESQQTKRDDRLSDWKREF